MAGIIEATQCLDPIRSCYSDDVVDNKKYRGIVVEKKCGRRVLEICGHDVKG